MAVVTSRAYGAIEGGTGAGEAVNEAANEAAGEAANAPSRISMLIPMVDMANHDDRKTNTVKVIILQIPVFLHVATPFFFAFIARTSFLKGLEADGDSFTVLAATDLSAGVQIYLSYGDLPNTVLLSQFGFILEVTQPTPPSYTHPPNSPNPPWPLNPPPANPHPRLTPPA